ncbi:MAG: hypothetical protein H8D80_01465, partial [Proteobacteria bacterium]|nr:hypothetical protein [Pseudomonadota bacterium]
LADNLTLRLKRELERRHGKVVSEDAINSFLDSSVPPPQYQATPSSANISAPWEGDESYSSEESRESKGGLINAIGVGLWSAFDTAAFGVPGAFVEEEDFLDFEDTAAKYTGAIGGLAGFVAGAPVKIGAKAVGMIAKPFIKKAGFESLQSVSKKMVSRGIREGVSKKNAKQVVGHYKKLAHKAQINKDFAKNFDKHATDLITRYTDDAVKMGDINPKEAIAITKMFGDNYTKRPLQDFIGLMAERGIAKTNPRFARVLGHAMNDALMFGMIDTVFEGVSMVEDNHFDWTAPIWGAVTGLAFSQISWLNPVGKGSKWFPDFKQGLRATFAKGSPYHKMNKEQLGAYAKFFGESLPKLEGGGKVVSISKGDKSLRINLASDDIWSRLDNRFGTVESKNILADFLDSQRKEFGKSMIKWSTQEGFQNLSKNWMRMAFGGVLFNTRTLAEMAIHGAEPDIHDILPHFLIGAFLQHGKNPARFDLNSTKMNEVRNNLRTLGFETRQLTHIPSFNRTQSRFGGGLDPVKNKETIRMMDEMTLGSEVLELVQSPLEKGQISVQIKGNSKFLLIYEKMDKHFKHKKSKDDISVEQADSIVKQFEKETGLKTLEEYERHFDELSVESTKGFEENLIEVIEKVRTSDIAQEIKIVKNEDGSYQIPKAIEVPESVYKMAENGELSFVKGADGEVLKGQLAVEKLQEKIDGYAAISTTTSAIMQKTKDMPSGQTIKEVKNLDSIENIYRSIEESERNVNETFANKSSSADPFTFAGSFGDYVSIIGRNTAIRSSQKITDMFSLNPTSIKRSELISHLHSSGLISDLTGESMKLRSGVKNIEIIWEENTLQTSQDKRGPELKRALKKVLMLQSISGGYEKSQDVDSVKIKAEKVEELLGFLKRNGLDIENMPSWLHEDTMTFIMRDKIGKSNLLVEEMDAFHRTSESGMAEFDFSLKKGSQGFRMSLIDESFVPEGSKSQASEYNTWARNMIKKSGGLIQDGGKKKVVNRNEIDLLTSLIPFAPKDVSAKSRLLDFITALPTNSKLSNTIGQYVMEGGAPDVESWLIKQGIIKYNKKSSKGWDLNMKNFTDELKNRLVGRINKEGFTPEYVKSMYELHEQTAKSAYDKAYEVESSVRFGLNNFLEKYNFDKLDFSPESKESKKNLMKELLLQTHSIPGPESFAELGYDKTGIIRDKVVNEVLSRISVKNSSGEWVEYKNLPELEKPSHKKEIVRDILKLVPSQYTSIRVNSFKFDNGIKESETFQQQTRQTSLYAEYDLPYVIVERDAVVMDLYNGRVQRRFFDIFGESSDLPRWENDSISGHRKVFEREIKTKMSAFGLEHKNGFVLMQVSKDTSPIAIARDHLSKLHDPYTKFAEKVINNENISGKVRDEIRKLSERMKDESAVVSDAEYNVALSQLTFADMLSGRKGIKTFEKFLNSEMDMDKGMGRIKLYDSKNFFKADRNLLHSMMNIYRESLQDHRTYDAIGKIFQQNGFGVAIWNDSKYSTIKKEITEILKSLNKKGEDWDLSNLVSNAHGDVSSFDSIAYVSKSMMRFGHAMMGNDPNSTNPFKPIISSGGRKGPLLMGKTLFLYSKSLDTFFETNSGVDILLASSGAKMFNEGKITKDGLDSSLINQPYNRINSSRKIGSQKIRKIPIDALGLRPDSDKIIKTAVESQGDFNYMKNDESGKVFRESYEKELKQSFESMRSIMEDPIRLRRFIELSFGEDGMGIDPTTGGGAHLNNLAFFASLTKDADPMSYSDSIVKNKLLNVFYSSLMNGRRSSIEVEDGRKANYGGQAYLIQAPDARYRLKPTIVDSQGKMKMRGEMMISEHERNASVSDMLKKGKEMRFVEGEKIYTGEELFGKETWAEIKNEMDLGTLFDFIEYERSAGNIGEDVQIGLIANRKPRTRPNDMMILGLKGFLPKSYGRSAIVNSLDVVNIFEGDYDADKIDYFYGHSKSMYDHVARTSNMFVQGIDPTQFKQKTDFSWGKDAVSIVKGINEMAANAIISKKAIGAVQNIPRKLQFLENLSSKGPEDPVLKEVFKSEGREDSPNVLLYTPNPGGGRYRIVIDFNNLDSYSRGALETQYMIDLAGGANSELMGDVRQWSDKYLFPSEGESVTSGQLKKMGVGFVKENIRKNKNSKRIRIFRKFDEKGNEQFVLTSLEKDIIKTMMSEYSKILNVSGEKTFAEGGENRSLGYEDLYSAADGFFEFNKNISNSLYYKLRWRKDFSGNPYWKDAQFEAMFRPKGKPYKDSYGKDKMSYSPSKDMFDGLGQGIKENANLIYKGERGSVLERSLRPLWEKDVFESKESKKFLNNSSVTVLMTGKMDSWYQQLLSGKVSEYSGSVDAMQSDIMKTVTDYNSAAYYISKLKKNVNRTNYNNNLSYSAKKAIVNKLNETIRSVEDRIRDIAPDKYWETKSSKDLKRFTFTPVVGKDVIDGVVQYNTIDNLLQFAGRLDSKGREHLQAIKDIRKMFYGNFTTLGDMRKYGDKTVLSRASLDFLANKPDMTTFYEIEEMMLKKGFAEYGDASFILEFMSTARNDFNIGIHNGQLIPMPYGKSGRYKRGLQFLTKMANETVYDDSRIQFTEGTGISSQSKQLLKILQITEANHRRFANNKFDMRNLSDPNYTVDIGEGQRFSLEHIKIPSFGRSVERVVGDFDAIKWARDTNRSGAGFSPINDSYLRFYSDIMEISGKTKEFEKYMDTMNGLKSDMISNRVIDPIEYLSVRSTIEKDLKNMVSDVITSGVLENGNKVLVSRIKNNPVFILNGGDSSSGFWSGRSLEPNIQYSIKKLREVVRINKELGESEESFRYKTEKSEDSINRFIERCGG